jgi:hypothetical protein
MRVRDLFLGLAAVACLALSPAMAAAQGSSGSIGGVVKDTSGAVMPGVTVEAASPALIEKVRSVVSDAEGLYKIVDLRPGTYTVTFTLPGFSTVRREGIELTAGVTVTVDGELRVGALEETITVSGAAPLVDVQNTNAHKTMTRSTMDDLPTGRSFASYAVLVPGITAGRQDVGGSAAAWNESVTAHGSRSNDMPLLFDGMKYNTVWGAGGGGGNHWVINNGMVEETSIDVSGMTAEAQTSGVRINSIPKQGGNRFAGIFYTGYTNDSLQTDNFTQDLKDKGATSVNKTKRIYDVNPGFGGPIKQDKAWFYGSYRNYGSLELPAGVFYNKNPSNTSFTFVADQSRPGTQDLWNHEIDGRVTIQTSQTSKLAVYYGNLDKCWCGGIQLNANFAYEAGNRFLTPTNGLLQGTWNWTATNKLLLEVGQTWRPEHFDYRNNIVDGAVIPGDLESLLEQTSGIQFRNQPASIYYSHDSRNWNGKATISYVTGSHNLRVGSQWYHGKRVRTNNANNNRSFELNNGVPAVVVYHNTPQNGRDVLALDLGLFVQEQYTLNKLTLNAGARFDYDHGYVPDYDSPATPYSPARHINKIDNVPNWKDINPRFGASYNVFGNGKTALKWNLGRFVEGNGVGISEAVNPALATISKDNRRAWNDSFYPEGDPRRGNYVPDCDPFDSAANGECGASGNSNFGTSATNIRYDPKAMEGWGVRGFNWETMGGITHEIVPGLSLDFQYLRRWRGNFRVTDNQSYTADDWDSYCITAPLDSRLPNGGGYQVCGLADIKPEFFGKNTDNVIRLASDFGEQKEVSDWLDLNIAARLPGGVTVQGGSSTGRTHFDYCFNVDSPFVINTTGSSNVNITPNSVFCNYTTPMQTQFKFFAIYPLKYGIRASVSYQSRPGPEILANYAVPAATVAASLGRAPSGNVRTVNVPLISPGTMYNERMHQLDIRVSKDITVGRVRMQPQFDLYNALNANSILAQNNTYAPTGLSWQRPTTILVGRLIKFGVQVYF